MWLTFSIAIIIFTISTIVMILASTLSTKTIFDREKNSPFECGFDPMNSARLPFSLQFFLIAVIFLIFDVEIALLLPMIFTFHWSNIQIWMYTLMFFILILIIGLFHEWNQGALEWAN
uniref:NADH-ubiquinone oxidoreductase chain 3 n=1 Tax=Dendroplectron aucklandense TaxID=3073470 RepID=A0AAU7BAF5_9ORTH